MSKKVQLQIKQLTAGGQLLSCVNCFSGQVSVFRAAVPSAVRPYMNALAGISGAERFILEVEHEPYVAYNNNLIGFGERFVSADGTAAQYLISNGIPQNQINSILMSYGLDQCMETPCVKLSRCEERRLRILTAVYDSSKILVINDPFDPISSEWRERFAELLVNFARTKSQIVIVPFLSYRPECWIDNEFIARIQVGENVQKTIGFASHATNIQAMINQIREEHGAAPAQEKPAAPSAVVTRPVSSESIKMSSKLTEPAHTGEEKENISLIEYDWNEEDRVRLESSNQPQSNLQPWIRRNFSKIAATGIAFAMLFIVTSLFNRKKSPDAAETKVAVHNPEVKNDFRQKPGRNKPAAEPQTETITEAVSVVNNKIEEPESLPKAEPQKLALYMRYPDHIRDSIINATTGNFTSNPKPINQPAQPNEQAKKNEVASDFLKLLATTGSEKDNQDSYDGQSSESYNPPQQDYNNNDSNWQQDEQARREQIRQKFLEAIQRAQERSQ